MTSSIEEFWFQKITMVIYALKIICKKCKDTADNLKNLSE